jgi:hypothetical protein
MIYHKDLGKIIYDKGISKTQIKEICPILFKDKPFYFGAHKNGFNHSFYRKFINDKDIFRLFDGIVFYHSPLENGIIFVIEDFYYAKNWQAYSKYLVVLILDIDREEFLRRLDLRLFI